MDEIRLMGLKIFGHHGVLEEEKKQGQDFIVDLIMKTDFGAAAAGDDLTKTTNYADVAEFVNRIFDEEVFDLIETVADKLAREILKRYGRILRVTVILHKPKAPIAKPFSDVSVTTTRSRHRAYIAVGSNLGDSEAIIAAGKDQLFQDPSMRLISESSLIRTKPYGVTDQPDFLNGMWLAETILDPFELLDLLHRVEADQKRERILHWGPRTLDLDIIYYDDLVLDSEILNIPHIDMANRTFVLEPLKEVDPYKRHPLNGMRAGEMLDKLK